MRYQVAALTAVFLAVTVAIASAVETAGVSREQLDALTGELEAQGKKWFGGEPVSGDLEKKLEEVRYDDDSLAALRSALGGRRSRPIALYVANHLLQPLLRADRAVIVKMLPTVRNLRSRHVKYQQLPKYADAAIAGLAMPPFDSRESAAVTMRKIAAVDKLRQEKIRRELPVARNNEQAYKLDITCVRLMLLAEDAEQDKLVMGKLVEEGNRGSYLFADIINAITASARHMSASRAKYFYEELRKLGERLRWERKDYVHPGQARLNPAGNSDFAPRRDYPGRLLLGAVNKLASKAQMPEVAIPSNQEINKRIGQRRKAGR